ncbi:hypothetical protein BASA50_005577 [Batrachochytrium salamandrivorans]|uniref:Cyclin N-terminal domain-containing protein n=1 Tax=Batrachochytrium salamandrivorans TaxID=1357716 RepID=A0ABQ8FFI1_9FUNG|nr:hypothetical protein BASA50_005577 [Batrachochytrium salamandrivorans]
MSPVPLSVDTSSTSSFRCHLTSNHSSPNRHTVLSYSPAVHPISQIHHHHRHHQYNNNSNMMSNTSNYSSAKLSASPRQPFSDSTMHNAAEHAAAIAITHLAAHPSVASTATATNTTTASATHTASSSLHQQRQHQQHERQHQQQQQQPELLDAAKLRAANIALSKTVLAPNLLSPYLPAFIATLTYSLWHGRSFAELSARPTPGLKLFARFTMDILRSTGLSFSVVLLALKYVHRIKSRKPDLQGAEGSECRLLVCSLMLAMKYLMDNTYSNKTWHKVSRIPLVEINVTEMEFLAQINFDLHVEEESYYEWLAFIEHAVVEFRRTTCDSQKAALQQQQDEPSHHAAPSPQDVAVSHGRCQHTASSQHQSHSRTTHAREPHMNSAPYPITSRTSLHIKHSTAPPSALSFSPLNHQLAAPNMPYPSPDVSPVKLYRDEHEHQQQLEQQMHHLRQQLRLQSTPLSSSPF